ncbi:PH domain-containing protein [Arthrobacter sp.]|uniref:PH domain-containing protein n=1 Tax=Arthrobacter sp. TaxID=1667 RepID=UPI002810D7F1|nr:PH domain-containing protein [Arthrobacter sp.]
MSPLPNAENVEVFQPGISRLFAWACWAVAVFGIVVSVLSGGTAALAGILPLLFVAYLGWLLFWRPAVIVSDTGVTLENPFRVVEVPWEALVDVDTRYSLTLITPRGKYSAWAAPAPGIWGARNAHPGHLRGLPESSYGPGNSVRPGDLKSTDSGAAAQIVRGRWQQLLESGSVESGRAEKTPVRSAVVWSRIGVAVILAGAGYGAILLF